MSNRRSHILGCFWKWPQVLRHSSFPSGSIGTAFGCGQAMNPQHSNTQLPRLGQKGLVLWGKQSISSWRPATKLRSSSHLERPHVGTLVKRHKGAHTSHSSSGPRCVSDKDSRRLQAFHTLHCSQLRPQRS
jgi:hypothetical protein